MPTLAVVTGVPRMVGARLTPEVGGGVGVIPELPPLESPDAASRSVFSSVKRQPASVEPVMTAIARIASLESHAARALFDTHSLPTRRTGSPGGRLERVEDCRGTGSANADRTVAGNPAIRGARRPRDRRLCVPALRRVCPFQTSGFLIRPRNCAILRRKKHRLRHAFARGDSSGRKSLGRAAGCLSAASAAGPSEEFTCNAAEAVLCRVSR